MQWTVHLIYLLGTQAVLFVISLLAQLYSVLLPSSMLSPRRQKSSPNILSRLFRYKTGLDAVTRSTATPEQPSGSNSFVEPPRKPLDLFKPLPETPSTVTDEERKADNGKFLSSSSHESKEGLSEDWDTVIKNNLRAFEGAYLIREQRIQDKLDAFTKSGRNRVVAVIRRQQAA